MKSLYVDDMRQWTGDRPINEGLFVVAGIEIRTATTGAPYLSLTLVDRTGSIPGLVFDCDRIPTHYNMGDAVLVQGNFNRRFNNINLQQVSKYTGSIDRSDFLATCSKDIDEMWQQLVQSIASIKKSCLKDLLSGIFLDEDVTERFKTWPAAKEVHHPYIGGLLEHTLTVTRICEQSCQLYDVDGDLLLAGALLHDIGKLQELHCELTITYTDIGGLFGHSLLGCFFVKDKILQIGDFPEQLCQSLLHIIASHHSKQEWGAIVAPMTLEAFLVSVADYTDARANRYGILIEQQRPLEQSIGARDYYLDAKVYAPKIIEEELWLKDLSAKR